MPSFRSVLFLGVLAALSGVAHATPPSFGIQPLPDQTIPSGKTLVVPIAATDPDGVPRSYTVSVVNSGTTAVSATSGGILATIRTGDPHLRMTVTYTDSNSVQQQDQPMEFQLYREFSPLATQIIAGLTEGGFYNPQVSGSGTKFITFHRVVAGQYIQGGDPNGDGSGGPGFSFANEYSNALIFSATAGQLALANAGGNETNDSQFFITGASVRSLDFRYTIFGQLLRGYATLAGIEGTPVTLNNSNTEVSKPVNPVDITSIAIAPNSTDAVLILSGTGVADATVTVTATAPGQPVTSGSFAAHLVADAVNDPPYLTPVPDVTTPASPLKITLQGHDLQLDLLRYGYSRVSPVADASITSGTFPTLVIPLVTGSNLVAATLDHFNASARGSDVRPFQVGVGEKGLQGTLTPIPAAAHGLLSLLDFPVAVVTAGNKADTAANFTADVNWGDGTFLSGSNGITIVKDGAAKTVNRFRIVASHTYSAPGEYPVIVHVADQGGARLTLTGTANLGAGDLAISAADLLSTGGKIKNKVIANFSDSGGVFLPSAYNATIDWGDGTASPGTIKKAKGGFQIVGSHTYAEPQAFTVNSTVLRSGTDGQTAAAWATARIAGLAAPQHYPPFPQAHLAQVWSTPFLATTGSGGTFQEFITGSVAVINSGNKTSAPGSISFYAAPDGTLDGSQTVFTTQGKSSLAIPALAPGQSFIFYFQQNGSTDYRLETPVGFDPQGDAFLSVVTYDDPVANYDGSQKVLQVGNFPTH